ncbi:maleylpyruvate isomerase family mycothiol-dependent enzyme [Aeromicrobium sp. CTD01-1L150]|uniref:maleylpyruvate isomerase family mycothiol-dependent enzyme n=1 Tax=Aeromicrobium sp. CTD01-1L150 TaxID=3341830 RepID=UPI0035C17023
MSELQTYVDAWSHSVHAVLGLTDDIAEHEWMLSTDLPGWTVHDVVAHLAHLEAVLAGQTPDLEMATTALGVENSYTEGGVQERRTRSTSDIVAELRAGVATREALLTELPEDPSVPADRTPGSAPWTWETLLRNRAVDVWCHEQDIRRTIERPGNLASPGAQVTAHSFAAAMPFVLGKRIAPPPGTSVHWHLTGDVPLEIGATIDDTGRARPGAGDEPTTTLSMTSEVFCILVAGRRRPADVEVEVTGDSDLGDRVLANMTITT